MLQNIRVTIFTTSGLLRENLIDCLIHNLKYQILSGYLLQSLSKCLMFLCKLQRCLYPCNITSLLLQISVLHNQSKTHAVQFYWFLILIDLNGMVYSWIFLCFFSMASQFSKKTNKQKKWIILWFLIFLCFLMFPTVFQKTEFIINLSKSFSKFFFVFCFLYFLCSY